MNPSLGIRTPALDAAVRRCSPMSLRRARRLYDSLFASATSTTMSMWRSSIASFRVAVEAMLPSMGSTSSRSRDLTFSGVLARPKTRSGD